MPPNPDTIKPRLLIINPCEHIKIQQPGDTNGVNLDRYLPAKSVNPSPVGSLLIRPGLMELTRGERYPARQLRGSAAQTDNSFPAPDQVCFHTPTTATIRGRKRAPPRSIPPRKIQKSYSYQLIASLPRAHGANARQELPLGTA